MRAPRPGLVGLSLLVLATPLAAEAPSGYKKPPEAVRKVLDIAPPPVGTLTPNRDYLLLAESKLYPSIGELAQPVLRLAGTRINPKTNGPQLPPRFTRFSLTPI